MTIRFGDKIRLASRDRWRLQEITARDPGDIDSFEALYNFLEWHRARIRGQSGEAELLRWFIAREWNRLGAGAGYIKGLRICAFRSRETRALPERQAQLGPSAHHGRGLFLSPPLMATRSRCERASMAGASLAASVDGQADGHDRVSAASGYGVPAAPLT